MEARNIYGGNKRPNMFNLVSNHALGKLHGVEVKIKIRNWNQFHNGISIDTYEFG